MDNYKCQQKKNCWCVFWIKKEKEKDPLPFPQPPNKKENVHHTHESSYDTKAFYWQFKRWTNQIRGDSWWEWLNKVYLKKTTGIMIIASQDQALNINNMWNKVFGENVSPTCTLCGETEENLAQLESECL